MLPSAVGFELPRDVGYGFHACAVFHGRRRLAAGVPRRLDR
ncbi:hed domain protein [Mycobacterium xenopi 3993]|nr:hed domain protein [Mycobacterium xenopi 3993]